jgi:DHA1 family bicyclomycin/chloramphenicol resistance-like MFS transporter
VITAIWFFTVQPETLRPEHRRSVSLRTIIETFGAVLRNKVCMGYVLAGACMYGAFVSYLATSQQVLGDIYGLGAMLPLAFGALALANGAASFLNARMVRRIGARAMSQGALLACALGGLSGAAAFAGVFAGVPPLWLHLVWIGVPVCAFGVLYGNLTALALEPMGDRAGAASSVVAAFGSGAGVLVAMLAGATFDGTVVPLYLTFGLAGGAGLLLTRRMGRAAT